jgi:hypothetical protein
MLRLDEMRKVETEEVGRDSETNRSTSAGERQRGAGTGERARKARRAGRRGRRREETDENGERAL